MLPLSFFDSVEAPEHVDSWLLTFALHVDESHMSSSHPTVKTPKLLVSPFLLARLSEPSALFDPLFRLGVELEVYPGADADLVDLVDAAGYANLLYLPPPPYCARRDVVRTHNTARWERRASTAFPPLHPDLPPDFVEAYLTFLADGLPIEAAWRLAEAL